VSEKDDWSSGAPRINMQKKKKKERKKLEKKKKKGEMEGTDIKKGKGNYSKESALLARLLVLGGALLVDETDEVMEDLVDVDLELGRGLDEEAVVEALGELLSLLGGDDTHVVEIALVADEDHGDVVRVLDAEDLLTHVDEVVEGAEGDDGVDEDKALAVLHVQVTHGRELLRTGSIENLQHALLAVNFDLLAVAVLDGGVVLLDKDALHELHSKGGLADTTRAQNDNLVFLKRHFRKLRKQQKGEGEKNYSRCRTCS